jgi:hypothetical protein
MRGWIDGWIDRLHTHGMQHFPMDGPSVVVAVFTCEADDEDELSFKVAVWWSLACLTPL